MIKNLEIYLPQYKQGYHLITDIILDSINEFPKNGILHLFLKHTSAAITINENADPTVLHDFEHFFKRLVPDDFPGFKHTMEGSDDMPAHIKSSLIGVSLQIPIVDGRLALGMWQGIYLCEFRKHGGDRKLILSIQS
jgi:secondary thiamine-phosphate synthase enzyme